MFGDANNDSTSNSKRTDIMELQFVSAFGVDERYTRHRRSPKSWLPATGSTSTSKADSSQRGPFAAAIDSISMVCGAVWWISQKSVTSCCHNGELYSCRWWLPVSLPPILSPTDKWPKQH